MTNISNFTISENMNARLAEYGLTSAMAEENGWISCDAAAIKLCSAICRIARAGKFPVFKSPSDLHLRQRF